MTHPSDLKELTEILGENGKPLGIGDIECDGPSRTSRRVVVTTRQGKKMNLPRDIWQKLVDHMRAPK